MKKCGYCGLENPDEATQCVTCNTPLVAAARPPLAAARSVTPDDEQRFWDRMTFKQFAALFVRLQAIWLLWYAAIDLTHLPSYVVLPYQGGLYINPAEKLAFFLLVLRIILHVAAAIAVIQHADRLLGWLVRDWIKNQPAGEPPPRAAGTLPAGPDNPPAGGGSKPASGDSGLT